MILFLDTEFNEFGGALISMALVPEDKGLKPFYEVVELLDPPGPWVAQHVMPHLGRPAISTPVFQSRLQAYLWAASGAGQEPVHILADWPDDFTYLCKALIVGPGEAINTPILIMHLRRDLSSAASRVPHNALYDAMALRDADDWIGR